MAVRGFALLYACVQVCIILFLVVGTPMDQFRGRDWSTSTHESCLTFWGFKTRCSQVRYDIQPARYFAGCPARHVRFKVAEAFSIVSIAVSVLNFIFGVLALCRYCRLQWVCVAFSVLAMATICVCWACMVSEYHTNRLPKDDVNVVNVGCLDLAVTMDYGAGFALYIIAWCLNVVNIVFLMLPC